MRSLPPTKETSSQIELDPALSLRYSGPELTGWSCAQTMAGTPPRELSRRRSRKAATLAEMLVYYADPASRRELEEYRKEYEATHGPTDLTKRYTSTWPGAQQDWLLEHEPKRWFDGLPPFAKAYLKSKMEAAARDGALDDMSDELLRLYIRREMNIESGTDRSR